jgi:GNAT superfamily N-acetyltransferase
MFRNQAITAAFMALNIHIQQAVAADVNRILELQKLAYRSEAELYNDYTILPLTQTLESAEAEFENQLIMKACVSGDIVGSVRAYMREHTCCIGRLVVHPDFQNQKIGTKLMIEIEEKFNHAHRYELFTGYRSMRNLHLYQKLGYSVFKYEKASESLTFAFLEKLNEIER